MPSTHHPASDRRTPSLGRRAAIVTGGTCLAGLAVVLPLGLGGAAGAAPAPATTRLDVKAAPRPVVGTILVTGKGMALYRDSNDKPNGPTCTTANGCAAVWPPLLLPAGHSAPKGGPGVTGLGTVKLADGSRQITFHKEPLYTFVDDSGTRVTGNGDGPFSVVVP